MMALDLHGVAPLYVGLLALFGLGAARNATAAMLFTGPRHFLIIAAA